MATGRIKGGKKLDAFIKNAKAAKGVESVEVGFYATDRYPNGQPVTEVAAFQEFGTKNMPERPFFRQSIGSMEGRVIGVLKSEINPRTMVVTRSTAGHVGEVAQDEIQKSVLRLDVKDTGFLHDHVRYEIKE